MRRSDTQKIDAIIDSYLKKSGMSRKFKEIELINSWEDVVGVSVSKRTTNIYIKNRVMYVYIESPIVKNEIRLLKDSIVNALNKRANEKVIDNIVLR